MRRLMRVARAGDGPTDEAAGSLTLAFADRHCRRLRLTTDQGKAVLLDLAEAAGGLASDADASMPSPS